MGGEDHDFTICHNSCILLDPKSYNMKIIPACSHLLWQELVLASCTLESQGPQAPPFYWGVSLLFLPETLTSLSFKDYVYYH
jgi:hypothetical protein